MPLFNCRFLKRLSLLALAIVPLWVAANTPTRNVLLSGTLGSSKAILVIGGQMRTVPVGATIGGVTVRSVSNDGATVLIDGQPYALRLGASPVSLGGSGAEASGTTIVLAAGHGGHFMTPGAINGKSTRFMVDTGATVIAMGVTEAQRLGVNFEGGQRSMANTAGGDVMIHQVTLASVRIGDVELRNLSAAVVQADMPYILLGNNFLSRFSMRRDGDTMRLEKAP